MMHLNATMKCCSDYLKRVQTDHADFLEAMYSLYDILLELRYLHEDEVVYPPYNVPGKPSLAFAELKQLGFTEEVVALMQLMPYPSNEMMNKFAKQHEGLPIAPDSACISYLAGSDMKRLKASRQPFSDGEVGIPAWAFKFTTCGLDFGTNYIYDTRSKLMARWDAQAQFEDLQDQPMRPSLDGLAVWRGELQSLDWVPWRVEHNSAQHMNVYSRPGYKQHLSSLGASNRFCVVEDEEDGEMSPDAKPVDEAVSRKLAIAKAVQNRYMYKRKLFEDCGWPHAFRGEEFEQRRQEIEKDFYNLISEVGPLGMHIQDHEGGRRLREWYKQQAGSNAAP